MVILIHYNEIWLKGDNRIFFERELARNIESALQGVGVFSVKRGRGRIVVSSESGRIDKENRNSITDKLKKVFGIANFSFADEMRMSADIKRINAEVYQSHQSHKARKTNEADRRFRIESKRSDKSFPMTSQEINEQVGDFIRKKTKMKVDLENPDITFFIEITGKEIYIYFEKIKGPGGLPVGASGKVLSLISSGIDSPVASWYLMKRGCAVDFIHFHGYPQTGKESIDNVKKIVKLLRNWQGRGVLHLVSFIDIQKEIIAKAPENYRVIMYRYFMLKIAGMISGDKALITGDSLGQVASQTIDNMYALESSLSELNLNKIIFRPLIGMDKDEIIKKAKEIGTYDISIKPYDDCCGFFVPKHPTTKASMNIILDMVRKIDEKIIKKTFNNIEHITW